MILALTGLIWGFQWFASSVYWRLGGDKSLIYYDAISDKSKILNNISENSPAIDRVWKVMQTQYLTSEKIEVHPPETLSVKHIYGRLKDAKISDKMIRMNYDIHTGGIFGFAGKILAFCASLIAASLPITGFMIWKWQRKKQINLADSSKKTTVFFNQ